MHFKFMHFFANRLLTNLLWALARFYFVHYHFYRNDCLKTLAIDLR